MTNKISNRRMLAYILKKQPNTEFVYFKRLGGNFIGDIIDMPLKLAEWTINQNPDWELVSSTEQMDEDIADLFKDESSEPLFDKEKSEVPKFEVPDIPKPVSDKEFKATMNVNKEVPVGKATKVTSAKPLKVCGTCKSRIYFGGTRGHKLDCKEKK